MNTVRNGRRTQNASAKTKKSTTAKKKTETKKAKSEKKTEKKRADDDDGFSPKAGRDFEGKKSSSGKLFASVAARRDEGPSVSDAVRAINGDRLEVAEQQRVYFDEGGEYASKNLLQGTVDWARERATGHLDDRDESFTQTLDALDALSVEVIEGRIGPADAMERSDALMRDYRAEDSRVREVQIDNADNGAAVLDKVGRDVVGTVLSTVTANPATGTLYNEAFDMAAHISTDTRAQLGQEQVGVEHLKNRSAIMLHLDRAGLRGAQTTEVTPERIEAVATQKRSDVVNNTIAAVSGRVAMGQQTALVSGGMSVPRAAFNAQATAAVFRGGGNLAVTTAQVAGDDRLSNADKGDVIRRAGVDALVGIPSAALTGGAGAKLPGNDLVAQGVVEVSGGLIEQQVAANLSGREVTDEERWVAVAGSTLSTVNGLALHPDVAGRPDAAVPVDVEVVGAPLARADLSADPSTVTIDVKAEVVPDSASAPHGVRALPPAPEVRTTGEDPLTQSVLRDLRAQRNVAAAETALPADFPADGKSAFLETVRTHAPSLTLLGPEGVRTAAEVWRRSYQGRTTNDSERLEGPLGAVLDKLEMQATNAGVSSSLEVARQAGVPEAELPSIARALFTDAAKAADVEAGPKPLWKVNQLLQLNAQAVAAGEAKTDGELDAMLSFRGQWAHFGNLDVAFDRAGNVRVQDFGLGDDLPARVYFGVGTHGDTFVTAAAGDMDVPALGRALLAGDHEQVQDRLTPLVRSERAAFLRTDADEPRLTASPPHQEIAEPATKHRALYERMRTEWDGFRANLPSIVDRLPPAFPEAKRNTIAELVRDIELTEDPTGFSPRPGAGLEPYFAPTEGRLGVPESFLDIFAKTMAEEEVPLFGVLLANHELWHQAGSGMHAGNISQIGRSGPVLMTNEYRADQVSNLVAVLDAQRRTGAPDEDLGRIAGDILDVGMRLTTAFDEQARASGTDDAPSPVADRRNSRFATGMMQRVMVDHVKGEEDLFALYGGDPMWAEFRGAPSRVSDRGDPAILPGADRGDGMSLVFEVNGKPYVYDDPQAVSELWQALSDLDFGRARALMTPIVESKPDYFMPWASE